MVTRNFNKQLSLRFRRWSRAGFAIFRSLSNAVSIGQLSFSIADKSLQKSTKSIYSVLLSKNDELSTDDLDELDQTEIQTLKLIQVNISEITTGYAAACTEKIYLIL
jgi:hypothetical protein